MGNLLEQGKLYYHPLTRYEPLRHKLQVDSTGETRIEAGSDMPGDKEILSPEEIVEYYYKHCGVTEHHNLRRDVGAVLFVIRSLGLDLTLFAIDCLISDYHEGEERGEPPDIIKATDFAKEASVRRYQCELVWKQYGLGSR